MLYLLYDQLNKEIKAACVNLTTSPIELWEVKSACVILTTSPIACQLVNKDMVLTLHIHYTSWCGKGFFVFYFYSWYAFFDFHKKTYKCSYIDSFVLWCLLIHTKCIYANKEHFFFVIEAFDCLEILSVYILNTITLYDLIFRTFWFLFWSYTEPLLCYDSLWWFVTVVTN